MLQKKHHLTSPQLFSKTQTNLIIRPKSAIQDYNYFAHHIPIRAEDHVFKNQKFQRNNLFKLKHINHHVFRTLTSDSSGKTSIFE